MGLSIDITRCFSVWTHGTRWAAKEAHGKKQKLAGKKWKNFLSAYITKYSYLENEKTWANDISVQHYSL